MSERLSDAEVHEVLISYRQRETGRLATLLANVPCCSVCGKRREARKSRRELSYERRIAALDIVLAERRERKEAEANRAVLDRST